MAIRFYINPAKVVVFPPNVDDNVVNGVQFGVKIGTSASGSTVTISPGKIRVNSKFMDFVGVETNFAGITNNVLTTWNGGLNGICLMTINESRNIVYVNDNIPTDKLVIAIIERRQSGPNLLYNITPVDYSGSAMTGESSSNIDISTVASVQTQLQMIFEEMTINKAKDSYTRYQEMIEELIDYNTAFVETFANDSLFVGSPELAYNQYTQTIGLGILAPYSVNVSKKLVEKVTLLNPVSKLIFAVDALSNGQTVSARISFDNGATWSNHTLPDQKYELATPAQTIIVEFSMLSNSSSASPTLRSWAILYWKEVG